MTRRIATAVLLAFACVAAAAAQGMAERIEFADFQKLNAAGKVLVVDVRDEQAFANGHIPGSINIPLGTEDRRLERLKSDKRPVVTYCA
jgi:rhodanese-related sulfurtransferase